VCVCVWNYNFYTPDTHGKPTWISSVVPFVHYKWSRTCYLGLCG